MHQDQRIGLALGVLLVGACAAFFFRNEARTSPRVPRLQHAQELDDRIAERSTRPYMRGVEAVEAADRNRSRNGDPHESPDEDHGANYWSPLDPPSDPFLIQKSSRDRKPRAKSLENESDIQELAPIAIPNDPQPFSARRDDSTVPSAGANSRPSKSGATIPEGQIHVVQKGETLSSIAAKTLGSPNRFHELFEANQDQLSDPNDVKLGMTLRIPDPRTASSPKPHINKPQTFHESEPRNLEPAPTLPDSLIDSAPPAFESHSLAPKNETQDSPSILLPPELPNPIQIDSPGEPQQQDESGSGKKFVPARRVPLPGRPAGPQATRSHPREFGGRKLSQASLESTSGKVAR